MRGARAAAIAAAFGIVLQGLDSGSIAGALLFVNTEFRLDEKPRLEGFIVSTRLIAAGLTTALAGPAADWLGRRRMLCASAVLFSISGCIMAWSPNVYVLLLGRLLVGTGIGFASTIIPVFIAESAPAEIRGQLSIMPHLAGIWGQFLAYCGSFGLSLSQNPNWRLMLGLLCIPSIGYLLLCTFFLPESPRWLVCKGRVLEAERVLRQLHNEEDVSGEISLMVEGLGKGSRTFQKYLVRPVDRVVNSETTSRERTIMNYGSGEDMTRIDGMCLTVEGPCGYSLCPRPGSASKDIPSLLLIDPLETNTVYHEGRTEHVQAQKVRERSNVENQEMFLNADAIGKMDENLTTPLLLRQNSRSLIFSKRESMDFLSPSRSGKYDFACESDRWIAPNSIQHVKRYGVSFPESFGSRGNIERLDKGSDDVEYYSKTAFLLQESTEPPAATAALPGQDVWPNQPEVVSVAAPIHQPAPFAEYVLKKEPFSLVTVHPARNRSVWSSLVEIGVRRALLVGVGMQSLQQFCGPSAVLFYAPQIIKQAGVDRLLPRTTSLTTESFSILASGFNCLSMLPCIVVSMKLIDSLGRRMMLLATMPVLIVSLLAIPMVNYLLPAGPIRAFLSFISLVSFTCSWASALGPIPNILCSEIFPTRVRGICIGLCSVTMWICNVIVCETFPILVAWIGLQWVFTFFGVMSIITWIFVFVKVPETKGFPLEVISEFFSLSNRSPSD